MSAAVVLDTNVLVSAALKPESKPARIVERVLLRQTPFHVCPSILMEYREVLNRPKFRPQGFPPPWLPRLLQVAFQEPDPSPWPLAGPDPDDLVFLALARATRSLVVTGNGAHFPEEIRQGVAVLSPAAFLAWQEA